MSADEERDGVRLTNLDQPLFDGDRATKRDLVDYLDAMSDRMVAHLRDRPLSVIRVRPGQPPFMQKNLPKYTPDWVPRATMWAEASKREISYPLGNDRRTLLWLANQRAVEYHPALFRIDAPQTSDRVGARHRPTRGRAVLSRGGRGPAGSPGARRGGTGRGGEDERREGAAHRRADQRRRPPSRPPRQPAL